MTDELMKIAIFQKKEIRKQLHAGEWWFVINDMIAALTDSNDPAQYLKRLRQRDEEIAKMFDQPVEKGAVQIVPPSLFLLILLVEDKNYYHGIPKVYSD